MAENLYDLVNSVEIAKFYDTIRQNTQSEFLGDKLFPSKRMEGNILRWIKGNNGLPVALQPSAFDTNAQYRERIPAKRIEADLPFFRESMLINEEERQQINEALAHGKESSVKNLLETIYDDEYNLVAGGIVQAERMRMQLLQTASISITAPEDSGRIVEYTYNYDSDGSWATNNKTTLTSTAKWTVANASTSTPIQDILNVIEKAADKGTIITEIVMNRTTYKGMMASTSIVKEMYPLGVSGVVTNKSKQTYIEDTTGVKITVYDKTYQEEVGGETKKYLEDNIVSFIPAEKLGNTYFAMTPEESDLIYTDVPTNFECTVTKEGIAVLTTLKPHPVNVETIVSSLMLPSFELIDKVYVMKVAD